MSTWARSERSAARFASLRLRFWSWRGDGGRGQNEWERWIKNSGTVG